MPRSFSNGLTWHSLWGKASPGHPMGPILKNFGCDLGLAGKGWVNHKVGTIAGERDGQRKREINLIS